eukprot:scpid48283/ scgid9350/ 
MADTRSSADLQNELEQLKARNSTMQNLLLSAEQKLERQKERIKKQANALRGARSAATKHKRERHEIEKRIPDTKPICIRSSLMDGTTTSTHTPDFMAQARFMKMACLLSNQKMAQALSLSHVLLTGKEPTANLGTSVSPSTIADWNVLLAEVDKALLQEKLASNVYDTHVFADDSNKRGEERHMVGIHTWCDKLQSPIAYVLANTIVASGSGQDQAQVDHHIVHDVYKVQTISAVIGDNASTQSGAKKGQAVELGRMFGNTTVFVGCYPHILNIALRNGMSEGLGQRGTMMEFNLFQLHYKVGYIHHQKPTYYKALYVSEHILPKPPPLPQEFVETRWSYIHASLKWWAKYGTACVKLGKKMLERLPVSETHYSIWSNIVEMAANDRLAAQRTMLLELLDRLIMPGLEKCQIGDTELNFSSGYLARMWPRQVTADINMAQLMLEYPAFALPLTENSKAALNDGDQEIFSCTHKAMFTAVKDALVKHGCRWHHFPLLFASGADTETRHLFWRAVLRVLGNPISNIHTFTHGAMPSVAASQTPQYATSLYSNLVNAALKLKSVEHLVAACCKEGILDRQQYLLGSTSQRWFQEFELLALVAGEAAEMQLWMQRWPIPDAMATEIRALADCSSGTVPTSTSEPHLWQWHKQHVFAIPVNNVIAERQFNVADIYVHPNESEASKQATHLFVENVLHSTADRLQLYKNLSAGARTTTRVTKASMKHVRKQMLEYSSTITAERLQQARETLRKTVSSDHSGRALTAPETYRNALERHKPRQDHEQRMIALEKKGKCHSVRHDPGRKKSAQANAAERSFPALSEE